MRFFEYTKEADKSVPLPQRGTTKSAGYDFYAPCDIVVPAKGCSELIPLNVKACMPDDEYLALHIRSSMAVKQNLMLVNSVAIIDSDYFSNATNEGNIGIKFYNFGDKEQVIKKYQRCCQGVFCKYGVTDDDTASAERTGGYGSTNK